MHVRFYFIDNKHIHWTMVYKMKFKGQVQIVDVIGLIGSLIIVIFTNKTGENKFKGKLNQTF